MVWNIHDPQGNEAAKVKFDVVPYMGNSNLDLGCGPSKVWPNFIGVDNGKDVELFGVQMKPDVVVATCERLPQFASESMDCVFSSHLLEHIEDYKGALREWWRLVKVGGHLCLYLPDKKFYPNIGEPGSNPDHKHDFGPGDILDAMDEIAPSFDLVERQRRDQLREYSFWVVFKKTDDGARRRSWMDPKPEKTVCIVRPGAYGDALWGGTVAKAYKEQGYHVTVMTGPVGRETLRADPHIDNIITTPSGMLDDAELILFYLWWSKKFTKWVNLVGAVEGRLLPHPNEIQYHWPLKVRQQRMGRDYYQAIFDLAELPLPTDIGQRFYPDADELKWASEQRAKLFPGPLVVLAPTGSGGPKTWPHVQAFLDRMSAADVTVLVMGELRYEIEERDKYQIVLGKDLPMRKAMALTQLADVVVGEETGILNAVASCDMPKVVLMSHSAGHQLTSHWKNTIALEPSGIPCHPCHRLHRAFEFCTKDSVTGWSACQAALGPDLVADTVLECLQVRQMMKAA